MFAVHTGMPVWLALVASLVIALAIGALNGAMVVFCGCRRSSSRSACSSRSVASTSG